MSSAYNKFNVYTTNLDNGVYNYTSHTLKAVLTNTLPTASNSLYSDITEISAGGGYATGGFTLTGVSVSGSGGVAKTLISNYTFTATGAVATFRYVVILDSTPTSPLKPLISWFDYGSPVTMGTGDTLTIAFDATNGFNQTT